MNLLSQQNGPIPMPLLSIGTATDITNNTYFECDFVPENGGILADEPTLDLFREDLKLKGLSDTEIDTI